MQSSWMIFFSAQNWLLMWKTASWNIIHIVLTAHFLQMSEESMKAQQTQAQQIKLIDHLQTQLSMVPTKKNKGKTASKGRDCF